MIRSVTRAIVYTLAWGGVLHELAHAIVARQWADVSIEWSVPAQCRITWPAETPVTRVMAAHLAPVWIGVPLGIVGALAAVAGLLSAVPWWAWPWLILNWLLFATPSKRDVLPFA